MKPHHRRGGYLKDLGDLVASVVESQPIARQPKCIAAVANGEESCLRAVPDHLRINSFGRACATLAGDIGNPQKLVEDLAARGFRADEDVLYIYSCLDHNAHPVHEQAEPDAIADRRVASPLAPLPVPGAHPESPASERTLAGLLGQWSPLVGRHGLIVLQVHSIDADSPPGGDAEGPNGPGTAPQRFPTRGLASADRFLLAMAGAGLFAKPLCARKYPRQTGIARLTLNWFEKRPYGIRLAQPSDLPALLRLEEVCWPEALRAGAEEILARIDRFPAGQCVVVLGGKVVGVIYSQRIASIEPLYRTTFREVHYLHTPQGGIAQLLAVNVLPELQHLGLGDQLLEFMLQYCGLQRGVRRVTAVSLCKDYMQHASMPIEQYLQRRDSAGIILDPILRFHESHGATIVGAVPGYRPSDLANRGNGVLVSYDILTRQRKDAVSTAKVENAAVRTVVQESILAVLGEGRQAAFDWKRSLRDIGMTSLNLLDLRVVLSRRIGQETDSTLFFQYGTPEALVGYFEGKSPKLESPLDDSLPEITVEEETVPPEHVAGALPDSLHLAEPVAIIGLSCRFPGGVTSPEGFWSLLRNGTDAIVRVPKSRWDPRRYDDGGTSQPGKIATQFGGFLEDVDQFDAEFFRISPREAKLIDPQQRILLEETWTALERAGISPESLAGSQTGVFVGVFTHDYELLQIKSNQAADFDSYFGTGNSVSVAAGRLAYFFGFQGPTIALDTACSSSLVALHLAAQSLRSGECELALVCGINLLLSPELSIGFSQAKMLAPDGRCKTFDAAADGYVRSEGCAAIVLKRLSQSRRDGDDILAVVQGTAINQDGASNGLTAPNGLAQAAVIRKALAAAQVSPMQVSYVETHGTGTPLGDPVEVKALEAAYGPGRDAGNPLVIGSVKTQIGHTEAAAGLAGLIKVVLALQNKFIPPHLHFKNVNPLLTLESIPAVVPKAGLEWKLSPACPARLAGVSSFGFSGTNAHVILSEAPPRPVAPARPGRKHQLLTMSARTDSSLRELARSYLARLSGNENDTLSDVCFTSHLGRSHFEHRLAVAAEARPDLIARLKAFLAGEPNHDCFTGLVPDRKPKIAFLFTGQGSQYVGMGRALYHSEPVFRKALLQCDDLLKGPLNESLLDVLYPKNPAASPIEQTAFTQPALFAIEYALAELWKSWGIVPDAVLGHSVGEYTAACVAGVFSLEDGLKLIAARGRLMQALPREGRMVAVLAAESVVAEAVAPYIESVSIATYNGPANIVISGNADHVQSIVSSLEASGIKTVLLNVSHAFHSPLMQPMLADFDKVASGITYRAPQLDLISNIAGALASEEVATPQYWGRHILQPVRFAAGMEALHRAGCDTFLEVGPKPVLLEMGRRCLPSGAGIWLASLRPGQEDGRELLRSLAQLYACGVNVDWAGFHKYTGGRRVQLPTYPFERKRFWIDSPKSRGPERSQSSQAGSVHPLLGRRLSLAAKETVFESWLSPDAPALLKDHRVFDHAVLPAAGYLSMAFAAAEPDLSSQEAVLTDSIIGQALVLPGEGVQTHTVLGPNAAGFDFRICSRPERNETGENTPWLLHASGRILVQSAAAAPPKTDLDRIRAGFGEEVSVPACYDQFQENRGLDYGVSFRAIKQMWVKTDEAFGRIRLPEVLVADAERYSLNPVLLDAAFQVFMSAFPEAAKMETYLPVGLEKFRVCQHTGMGAWCHASLHPAVTGDQEIVTGDLHVFDEKGGLVLEASGFSFKRASRQAVLRNLQADWKDWLYEISWVRKARPGQPVAEANPGQWLILADSRGLGQRLAQQLKDRGQHCALVLPSETYEQLPGDVVHLNPAHPDHFDRLLAGSSEKGRLPWRGVVHLWGSEAASAQFPAADANSQLLGCGTALHLVQAFLRLGRTEYPRLYLVTRGVQPAGDTPATTAVNHATLWGFGRVIRQEHPEFRCVRIDLDAAEPLDELGRLTEELWSSDEEEEIALRSAGRYVARLARHPRRADARTLKFDPHSSYLVTGGFGALGLKIVRWMFDQGARHLVLTGRSGPTAESRFILKPIEEAGARVLIARADVSIPEELAGLFAQVDATMPSLRGVIHAAGVMDEGALRELTWERCVRVLAAKVKGTWNLHALTQNYPLEFFVCFSSISSVLGSVRLGAYAAANAFMDALAHRRRAAGLPALSINWGPWAEAGMAARMENRDRLGMTAIGLGEMQSEQGLQVLAELATGEAAQLVVAPLNWKKYLAQFPAGQYPAFFQQLAEEVRSPRQEAAPRVAQRELLDQIRQVGPGSRLPLLTTYVRQLVAGVLRQSPDRISTATFLNKMGLDSLMALELRNQIGTDLSVEVPMVRFLQSFSVSSLAALLDAEFSKTSAVSTTAPGDPLDPGHPSHPAGSPCTAGPASGFTTPRQKALVISGEI